MDILQIQISVSALIWAVVFTYFLPGEGNELPYAQSLMRKSLTNEPFTKL